MVQNNSCRTSRPVSRPAHRTTAHLDSARPRRSRLSRAARRLMVNLLIVSGTSLASPASPLWAHDHAPSPVVTAPTESVAVPTFPARLVDNQMLQQWYEWADGSSGLQASDLRTDALGASDVPLRDAAAATMDAVAVVSGPANREDSLPNPGIVSAGPQGANGSMMATAIQRLTTAAQWMEYCRFQTITNWRFQGSRWVSPLVEAARAARLDNEVIQPIAIAAVPTPPAGDIQRPATLRPPVDGSRRLVGSGPLLMSIPDPYSSYDMSPEDAIALRMYPIAGVPQPQALAVYPSSRLAAIYADSHETIAHNAMSSVPQLSRAGDEDELLPQPQPAPGRDSDVAHNAMSSVPQLSRAGDEDELLPLLPPIELAWQDAWRNIQMLASLAGPEPVLSELLGTTDAARMLLADTPQSLPPRSAADSTIAVVTDSFAADINPDSANDSLQRAQVMASACDLVAGALEQLAVKLRSTGDSLVRQAQADAAANDAVLR